MNRALKTCKLAYFIMIIDQMKFPEDQVGSLNFGGECSIQEIIEEMRIVLREERELCDKMLLIMRPE